MKYTFCEMLIWTALAGPSFRELNSPVSRKKAKRIFREMVARTPDIGNLRENPLRICLSGGMVWLSIYKAAEGGMDEASFAKMVSGGMDSPLIRAAFKSKAKTAFTLAKQLNRKAIADRFNPLCRENPYQWYAEVRLGRNEEEYMINYRQCGLCALGRQEGLLHLVKHMCVLDIMSIEWMGGALHRTQTLAAGGEMCDFYICKKGSKWDA